MASDPVGDKSSDAVVPDDVSLIDDDATGAVAPTATHARRGCAGKAAVAGLLVVLGVALVVAILAGSHASSGVSLPDTFTATYTAFDKQSSAASKVTGVLYKVRAPTGSRLQWHARGVASMSAGGGTQVRTVTVVDDQGVVQTHTAETEDAGRELVATRCADASHFPSLSSVTSSLDSATAVSEGQMREVVGGGACEGDAWTRFLVRVGQVPVVVCWQDGFKQVQVLGEEFYAVLDVTTTVDKAAMEAVSLPPTASGDMLDCPLLDHAATESRRLRSEPQRRRLCTECDPNVFPPEEDCCRRRLDGTLDVQPVPPRYKTAEGHGRHTLAGPPPPPLPPVCDRSSTTNVRKCVFVHGFGVDVDTTFIIGEFPEYWGDVHRYVDYYCTSVKFIKFATHGRDPLSPSVSEDLCSALELANGGDGALANMLLFVHAEGNLMLARAILGGFCSLPSSSYWMEIQSGRHLSALADWGTHFCANESPPGTQPALGRRLAASSFMFESFVNTYPFCSEATRRRRLQVGGGSLNDGWMRLDGTSAPDFSQEAEIIAMHVDAFMCSVDPSKAGPHVRFEAILNNGWDMSFPEYPTNSKWSKCWQSHPLVGHYRSTSYAAHMSMYDLTCRSGDAWYDGVPEQMKPCSWYTQMACMYGGPPMQS